MTRRRLSPEQRESVIQEEIRLALGGRGDVRLWRNNRGVARRRHRDGSLGRPVEFGLAPGAADLIGWVIPSGRFLSVEVKSPNGEPTVEQLDWASMVRNGGGIAIICCSAEEAVWLLDAELHCAEIPR
jgi:hypothetical protein